MVYQKILYNLKVSENILYSITREGVDVRNTIATLYDKYPNSFIPLVIIWTFSIMSFYGVYVGIEFLCKYIRKYYYVQHNYIMTLISIAVSAFLLMLVWEFINNITIFICELFNITFYTSAYILCFIAFISFAVSFEVKEHAQNEKEE